MCSQRRHGRLWWQPYRLSGSHVAAGGKLADCALQCVLSMAGVVICLDIIYIQRERKREIILSMSSTACTYIYIYIYCHTLLKKLTRSQLFQSVYSLEVHFS